MTTWRSLAIAASTLALAIGGATSASAHESHHGPVAKPLATFGSGLGSGSTIGPDGALYVTDGNAGSVVRISRRSGATSTYATGLPTQVLGIGGAMDVAFIGRTAYVLVTMVGGELLIPGGPVPIGDATVGIYRLARDGTFHVVADIGAWSVAHPPAGDYFIRTGVQYSLQPYRKGFAVADGHHNRVLYVGLDGSIEALTTFTDIVPTGLEAVGRHLYLAEAGPVPHRSVDARVVEIDGRSGTASLVAAGAPAEQAGLTVDVERGPGGDLYALLQGVWDLAPTPENEGAPASANTGRLVRITRAGGYETVVDGLDRPTSVDFVGDTAYVVSLSGAVTEVEGIVGHGDDD